MKLLPAPNLIFLLSLATATNRSRCQRRTLSATTKKPASLAGFRYLMISKFRLAALVPSRSPTLLIPPSLKLIIQTPSSLYPA